MEYHEVTYGNYTENSEYDWQLVQHIFNNYLFIPGDRDWSLLDLGCGNGKHINQFKRFIKVSPVEGIDSEIDLGKDTLPWTDNSFKFIFCKSTIEHVPDTKHFLFEALRVLKPRGRIVILSPAWEYNYKWFYDDPTHVKPFHRKGLQDAMRMADFKNVNVKYFYNLPSTWDNEYAKLLATVVRQFTPDSMRWTNAEENIHRPYIRFCKEVQLLAIGEKE